MKNGETCYETVTYPAVPDGARLLGEAVLMWSRAERVSDRYGAVHLVTKPIGGGPVAIDESVSEGTFGELVCEIVAIRQSEHIGDIARGIGPRTPTVGQVVSLGQPGRLVYSAFGSTNEMYRTVGIKPTPERDYDWLNPRALYDCHDQTVRLYFVPRPS